MTDTELLTPQEYARYRRCSVRTLDRERAVGCGCPYVKLGARILYRQSDIERFLAANIRGDFHGAGEPPRRGHPRSVVGP
jgi:hypothetical protein